MQKLTEYMALQKEIFNYFGYVEDWRILPINDSRLYYWCADEYEVKFADSEEALLDEEAGEYYSNQIYYQRHLPKWVYRGEEYTMIAVDTHTDGNQFLQIFDNAKEMTI